MTLDPVLLLPLIGALTVFLCLWPVSIVRRDASVVDFFWAPGFAFQLGIALWLSGSMTERGWLIALLVALWSARLSWTMISRRLREGHEDPRYTSLRASWDPGFWWKSFFVVFLLQGVLQWLIALGPILSAVAVAEPLGLLAIVGCLVALTGIAIETVADLQLDRFKRNAKPDDLLTSGLRAHVRYPNYSGEVLFWIGLGLIGAEVGIVMGLVAAMVMGFLLAKVSGAPMLDERLEATRPGYAEYRARVPAFVPSLSGLRATQ